MDSDRHLGELVADVKVLRDATDVADLFAALARTVRQSLDADACVVSVYDEPSGRLRDVAASVRPPVELNTLAQEYLLDDFPTTKAVIESRGHAEISKSDPGADKSERRFLQEMGFERLLICGFSMDGEVKGTVETFRLEDRAFGAKDPEQVGLVVAFATDHYIRIQLAARLEAHYTETIETLVSALEARDPRVQPHSGRTRDLALAVALALQVSPEERKAVHLGALLHDVGMIGVPEEILRKPGGLTSEDWAVMREHPEVGVRMLEHIEFLGPALPVIRHHHERWDGSGYPDGLKGEAIPLAARIVGVCDAYDAMTSERPFRSAMAQEQACGVILTESGTLFDPRCAQMLVDVLKKVGERHLEDRFVRYAL